MYAWNPRHHDCYCERGSYAGLVLGGTALCWIFGPGIILLDLRKHHRRAQLEQTVCVHCGYDLRGSEMSPDAHCPECEGGTSNR